ncbi:TRAP transporter large permease [Amylibacter sp.]|jgi:tripartite ATP-independent transporter DctM subunit|nr:TRAP transporter large permease [Amylibacter sp.]MDB4085892.1 TRAP transporter large permease [Amylibacter sp.]MDC1211554.1 TRAP transporter large permease [Amylibacter sp.]MDC1489300.1 TRAP transporter large permease [Amylibacter sp.]|tara:strand:- start:2510 stop:3823 length:1314 start_codon:yes stop_codon:yes gene_type:complete
MEWYTILISGIFILFALFLSGAPIYLAFLGAILIGIYFIIGPAGFPMFANSILDTATTTSLASIPLFILMGELLFRSGTMDVLFDSIDKLVGKVKGRQYVLVVVLSAVFGALSGVAMAVAAMLGRAIMPGMQERGYDRGIAAGLIIGGASLAPIIPPSLLAIIVGSLADVSIAKLLIAGVIPGLLIGGIFLVYTFVRIAINSSLAPENVTGERGEVTNGDKMIAIVKTLPFMIVMFSVMGFIMLGIATPSESAATGVVGSLITAAIYRKLSIKMIWASLLAAVTVSAMILVIMAMSKMFTQLLAFTGATSQLVNLVVNLGYAPIIMLLIMLAVPFILCMFIDTIAVILLTIPIYQPVVNALEFDPVWFWLLFLVNITLGAITPPFGYTLFAFKAVVPEMSISDVYRATWPFVALFIVGIMMIIVFPSIATWLPNLVG